MSEKLCLKWNDYQDNVNSAFGSLREDNDFADVTLACEDGQQIDAHKVILAASSPFFQNLLKKNKHPHPLIYMKGIKHEILLAVVDFLYLGEANVFQESLDSFLEIAEELRLKGLMGQAEDATKTEKNNKYSIPEQARSSQSFHKGIKSNSSIANMASSLNAKLEDHSQLVPINNPQRISLPNFVSGDFKELDEKVKSMMEKSQNMIPNGKQANGTPIRVTALICKMCGKEDTFTHIRNHIEANHLEGISIPCDCCDKTFSTRSSLGIHKSKSCVATRKYKHQ